MADEIPPSTWGPPAWRAMHARALAPDLDFATYGAWLEHEFAALILCPECLAEFRAYFAGHWPAVRTHNECFLFGVNFQNQVNRKLGRDEMSPGAARHATRLAMGQRPQPRIEPKDRPAPRARRTVTPPDQQGKSQGCSTCGG